MMEKKKKLKYSSPGFLGLEEPSAKSTTTQETGENQDRGKPTLEEGGGSYAREQNKLPHCFLTPFNTQVFL